MPCNAVWHTRVQGTRAGSSVALGGPLPLSACCLMPIIALDVQRCLCPLPGPCQHAEGGLAEGVPPRRSWVSSASGWQSPLACLEVALGGSIQCNLTPSSICSPSGRPTLHPCWPGCLIGRDRSGVAVPRHAAVPPPATPAGLQSIAYLIPVCGSWGSSLGTLCPSPATCSLSRRPPGVALVPLSLTRGNPRRT